MAADEHAIAVACDLVARKFEADEGALRVGLALDQRRLAAEIVLLRLERHREADSGLEGIGLIVELVAGKDQARLDPQHVERLQAERAEPVRLACQPRPHPTPPRNRFGWQKIS